MKIILGKKIGMSQVFNKEDGSLVPVTVVDVSSNVITKHLKQGEEITHIEIGKDKQKNPRNVDLGNYEELKFVPRFKKVFKIKEGYEVQPVATELQASLFEENDIIDVTGKSKGKGFAGVMKRWNFKGGKRTHGQSDRERAPGSIGSGTTPGRVVKGKKMAGHMGNEQVTVKKLKIVDVNPENKTISVSGSIPGYNGSYVIIKESVFNK